MGKTSKVLGKAGYSLDGQSLDVPIQVGSDITDSAIIEGGEEWSVPAADLQSAAPCGEVEASGQSRQMAGPPAEWDERLTKVAELGSRTAESFRILRSKILLPQDGRPALRTIAVTSALPREGKSFVTANLGIALAQGVDQHALLVDCDLRLPSLAGLFGVPTDRGLADYLLDKGDLASLLQKTSMDKLSILASGLPPANPAELLGSSRMQSLVAELSGRYPDRYVIFDTPPLEVASESKVLSQCVDGVVLVVRQGVSSRTMIEKFIADIGKEKIIGVIFNGQQSNFITDRLVYKSHYYYGNYYGRQDA